MGQVKCTLTALLIFFAGCAGREARPIAMYQAGDERKNCEQLKIELAQIEQDIRKKSPHTDKTLQNVACVAGGILVIAPFFFMDLKNADKIEVEALQSRYNYLSQLASSQDCAFGVSSPESANIEQQEVISPEVAKTEISESDEQ